MDFENPDLVVDGIYLAKEAALAREYGSYNVVALPKDGKITYIGWRGLLHNRRYLFEIAEGPRIWLAPRTLLVIEKLEN